MKQDNRRSFLAAAAAAAFASATLLRAPEGKRRVIVVGAGLAGPSMQWAADFAAHKPKPTNTVPGITYMLAGATQHSDSDPYDRTSPAMTVPPHWMIMWPFDPKATGLPTTHRDTGAYIMSAGSPYGSKQQRSALWL
jgi:hypothetical protein